jgi:hypothetical protein
VDIFCVMPLPRVHTFKRAYTTLTAICHTGVIVGKMETSMPFYRDSMSLQIWWDQIEEEPLVEAVSGVPGARIHTVKPRAPDGLSIELI